MKESEITEEVVLEALKKYHDLVGARELARKLGAYKNWNTVEMHLYHLYEKRKIFRVDDWSFKVHNFKPD